MQQEPQHERLLVPWGQVISERDKSGVRKLLHHSKKFLSQFGKSRPMSPQGPIACDHVFFCTLIARAQQPIITNDKKSQRHGGSQKITTKWSDDGAHFV